MLNKNMTHSEIESVLGGLGDFVQIDHLLRFLREPEITSEMKKFNYLKLARIYEKKGMFFDAAKSYSNAAIYSLKDAEKGSFCVKECESLISGGFFEHVDKTIQKGYANMTSEERAWIYNKIKELYRKQAENYESQLKRSNAVRVYEKMLELRLSDFEKKEIKERLMGLYEKLGKKKEYMISGQNGQRRKTPWIK